MASYPISISGYKPVLERFEKSRHYNQLKTTGLAVSALIGPRERVLGVGIEALRSPGQSFARHFPVHPSWVGR